MDPRKSSACGGDDDLPLVSSMGGVESKNRCCVIDDDVSIGTELCEKPNAEEQKVVVITGKEDDSATKSDEFGETSKSKKKKKNKSGRSTHDEDDLDKILAGLVEILVSPASKMEKIQAQSELVAPGEKDGEEETVESAAAKKKRKKKDRDKKVDASSVEAKEDKQENPISEPSQPKNKDVNVKVVGKKVPKHVREMQEVLARRKEAEERKKKEEEERMRKEERGRRAPHRGRARKGS